MPPTRAHKKVSNVTCNVSPPGPKSMRVDTFSASRPQEHGIFTPKKPLPVDIGWTGITLRYRRPAGFARTSELSVPARPPAGYGAGR